MNPLATEVKNPRSIAYLTSADVTSLLYGFEYMTPFLISTVTVLPSGEISGGFAARSGTMLT
jgi:hypothetical protein